MLLEDLERLDEVELRARLELATQEAFVLADELVLSGEVPFQDLMARDKAAEYRAARKSMKQLRRALTLVVAG